MVTDTLERQNVRSAMRAVAWTEVDWEAPAGGDAVAARLEIPRFVYLGYADPHWHGQSCDIDGWADLDVVGPTVVFACGCHGSVPWCALQQINGLEPGAETERRQLTLSGLQ